MLTAFGTTDTWKRCTAGPSEVFLFRTVAKGITLKSPRDALLFARAVGIYNDFLMNVRAIVVNPIGPDEYGIEVVMMALNVYIAPNFCVIVQSASDLAKKIVTDPAILARFPGVRLDNNHLVQITGPGPALDFWRAHWVLWDKALGDKPVFGTPTGAGTKAYEDANGVYLGMAELAPNLRKWTAGEVPIDDRAGGGATTTNLLWIGGAVLVVWLGAKALQRRRPSGQGARA
jgi:hypothetical protein